VKDEAAEHFCALRARSVAANTATVLLLECTECAFYDWSAMVCFEIVVLAHFVTIKSFLARLVWFHDRHNILVVAGLEDIEFVVVCAITNELARRDWCAPQQAFQIAHVMCGTCTQPRCKDFPSSCIDKNAELDWSADRSVAVDTPDIMIAGV